MLYLIEDRDYLKIGYSTDIESRIKSYKTTNVYCKLLDIKDGERWNETELHKLCQDYFYTGEGFKNCPEVLEIGNNYNPKDQYDYKRLLEILKKFSNLGNFDINPRTSSNCQSFIDLYRKNKSFIDDTGKRDTPFFNFIRKHVEPIGRNGIALDGEKPSMGDYMKAIQSSVKCLINLPEIESKIMEQLNTLEPKEGA